MLGAAALSALAAMLTAEELGPEWMRDRLLAAATLGIPLFTAVTLAGERMDRRRRILAPIVALLVLLAVWLDWPEWTMRLRFLRYAQLCIALHLMVAFLPFGRREEPNAFWQYNRVMFVRFIASGVFSGVLYGGLALAFAALDKLFGVDVPQEAYARLWFLMAFIFNTWFFLGGLPEDLGALEQRRDYPAVIRVFAQYTLVPLVSMYLVILTLYFGKVVVTWDWPKGWIGFLVSGVATTGILAQLLVHPIAEEPEQKWLKAFARDFWIGILPAVLMLWLALYQRIRDYGVTEPRYFLLVLSLWLGAIAVYYGATRSRSIRVIPISLFIVAGLTFAGPWGAYSVSAKSQLGRLREILARDSILVNGRITGRRVSVTPADVKEISSITRYIVGTHTGERLAPWFADSTAQRLGLKHGGWARDESQARHVVDAFGVRYLGQWESAEPGSARIYIGATGEREAVAVAGFDYLVPIAGSRGMAQAQGAELAALTATDSRSIRVIRRGQLIIDVPLDSLMGRLVAQAGRRPRLNVPPRALVIEAQNARARVRVMLRGLTVFDRGPQAPGLQSASGEVLVKLK